MKIVAVVSVLSLTGCTEWLEGAAHLAKESSGISWPGAFLVVGVCAALAWTLGKVFG
jgi:hypothetical protein